MSELFAITFDVEATGINTGEDQIIELCVKPLGSEPRTYRIKPDVPISAGAQEVHGISASDLEDCPRFADIKDELFDQFFGPADVLIGYNVDFDIRMVNAEYERAGDKAPLYNKHIIDPYRLWQKMEPRKLVNAYAKFIGGEMENAHAAEADVCATELILGAMQQNWGLGDTSWSDLAEMCRPPKDPTWVGYTHHFQWSENGKVIFGFGKHKGERIAKYREYLEWMQSQTFPSDVKRIVTMLLDGTFNLKP